jgi:ubiquinone/menaquinone biosynthesis C-methylase UbiE
VLDVGCGPGRLRLRLDPEQTTYYGVDPLPNPEVSEFPFARAIAEYLPFPDDFFACVVVRSALDHFCDLDAFFSETVRVLQPGGTLFLEQVIHEIRGPVSAAKGLVHAAKDLVDHIRTPQPTDDAPKHMNEFTKHAVLENTSRHFELEATKEYSPNWYTPTQLFVALKPKERVPQTMSTA